MNFCKYSNIFGEPNTGVHKYRVWDIAIVDLLMTIVGAWLLSIYFKYSFIKIFIGLMVLGLLAHKLFCVKTTITKLIFID